MLVAGLCMSFEIAVLCISAPAAPSGPTPAWGRGGHATAPRANTARERRRRVGDGVSSSDNPARPTNATHSRAVEQIIVTTKGGDDEAHETCRDMNM